jgi:hypothetical protein
MCAAASRESTAPLRNQCLAYASEKHVTFVVDGVRFRKDDTLGKVHDSLRLHRQ